MDIKSTPIPVGLALNEAAARTSREKKNSPHSLSFCYERSPSKGNGVHSYLEIADASRQMSGPPQEDLIELMIICTIARFCIIIL